MTRAGLQRIAPDIDPRGDHRGPAGCGGGPRAEDADSDDDSGSHGDSDAYGEEVHGIPEGHMPPLGACRIWNPDLPPGQQQTQPGDCDELRADLASGSWLLFRPNEEPRVYNIA